MNLFSTSGLSAIQFPDLPQSAETLLLRPGLIQTGAIPKCLEIKGPVREGFVPIFACF